MQDSEFVLGLLRQLSGVCVRLTELAQEEVQSELMDEMYVDELTHAQKLVVELTRCSLGENASHNDEAFFEGELNDVLREEEE